MALTNKQRVFIAEYVRDFNATRAATAAGYSEKTAYSVGWENLRKPEIAEEIQKVIADRCMTETEVLVRLAEHARGDIGDLLNDGGSIDWGKAREGGKTRLVKKITIRTVTTEDSTTETESLELYDAQSALVQIGRHYKLFTDKNEIGGEDGGPVIIKVVYEDARVQGDDAEAA